MAVEKKDIVVRLNSTEELFAEPTADPFDPNSRYQSGIDEILGQLRLAGRDWNGRLVISLPAAAVDASTQPVLGAALDRYVAAKINADEQARRENRLVGRQDFIISILITGLLFVVIILLAAFELLPEIVMTALVYWSGIAAWVILWDPVYTFVYASRPYRREERLLEKIRAAELAVVEQPG